MNAHAHLELGQLESPLGREGIPFFEWVPELVKFRCSGNYDPVKGIENGLKESLDCGVKEINDVYLFDIPLEAYGKFPEIRCNIFVELISWRGNVLKDMEEMISLFLGMFSAENAPKNCFPAISPHAPQTVHREILESAVEISRKQEIPLMIHLAESPEEVRLLKEKDGPLLEMMRSVDHAYDPEETLFGSKMLDYLKLLAESHFAWIVHGNYLAEEDFEFLGANRKKLRLVHCPRSHRHFGYRPLPSELILKYEVPISLGTDSRASSPDIDIRKELELFEKTQPDLVPLLTDQK